MKFLLILITIVTASGTAFAGDDSCQVNLLKPKINPSVIAEEDSQPAKLTVAEARLRLQQTRQDQQRTEEESQDTAQVDNAQVDGEEAPAEAEENKKSSRLGGIFDILLPSKLRNPVK